MRWYNRHVTQPTDTSIASQDYLEQIFQLIALKGYARSVDIAANLGVSQASVSAMLKRLGADGLVVYEKYRGVILTDKGSDLAQHIIKRHEVLTRLLRHFGVDEETIYRDVEGMEHHISSQSLKAFTLLANELDQNESLRESLLKKITKPQV
ncbi:MAG: transcriptional regulator MntR [Verrucomicrobia bacterium]|jgi:Mn-dependent DtxR family transcriptional regulator|nr:MAG: transcriptional regulator MntR [Verrucomicrobiota bacterium]